MRKALNDFLDVFRDLLKIMSWFETWVPSLIVLGVIAFWVVFTFALSLPNPWRSIIIWGMIFGVAVLAPKR